MATHPKGEAPSSPQREHNTLIILLPLPCGESHFNLMTAPWALVEVCDVGSHQALLEILRDMFFDRNAARRLQKIKMERKKIIHALGINRRGWKGGEYLPFL